MFQPDSDGLLHPTGSVAGGHEWLLVGQETRVGKPCYKMHQSWGNWGVGGYAWIAKAEYEVLFRAQGDATLILESPL
jgi:C1A family cysteine protease